MKRFVCLKTTPRFGPGAIKLQHRRAARAERGRAGVDRFVDRKRFVDGKFDPPVGRFSFPPSTRWVGPLPTARRRAVQEGLQEKRAALITQAVTRGLDPNVSMKDSGVEWLGEIPATWRVIPLKRILRRCDYGISESLAGGGDIRVLTMAHLQDGEVLPPQQGSVAEVEESLLLDNGDLLFNRTNSRDLVGKVGIFRGPRTDAITFASYLVRMAARDGIVPEWLNFLLNSKGVLALARSMALLSVNQANLNPTKYTQIVVPLPPKEEQAAIAQHLGLETARAGALTARVRDAIARLEELRTGLISAAVTGKIDVRGEAA